MYVSRFDISVPARSFVERFYNPSLKGYGISNEDLAKGKSLDVDIFMSSHLGLLSLYFGGENKKYWQFLHARILEF